MGNAIGKASTDIGGFIGNIFTTPFKATIGRSCLDVCSGPWDLTCFIEHFCLPDIAKLLLISSLCFIILIFITLLFKLGICQCVVKSICKMSCAACASYWCAIGDMVRFSWHSLSNVKRVRRRRNRFDDLEAAAYDNSSDDDQSSSDRSSSSYINNVRPKQRRRLRSKHHHHHRRGRNRRVVRLRSRQMSVRVGGKSKRVRSRNMKSVK